MSSMTDRDRRRPAYWRSLEQLAQTPEARTWEEREFPEQASSAPQGVSRREMLGLLGASLSFAGLTACRRPVETIVPYVNAPENVVPGIPRHFATTMPFGVHSYGVVVESHEGRPTKIEGNELHPSSAGASSARVQAAILGLYDPDRSRKVLGPGEARDWAAFEKAWKQLDETHLADGGAGLAVLSEPHASPTLARLTIALRQRFPALRWATWEPISDEFVYRGVVGTKGQPLRPLLQLERARVVLSLDADLLGTDGENIRHARGFAAGRRLSSERDEPNRLYVAESSFTCTGGAADHRLRLRSRLIGALTLALAAELDLPGAASVEVPGVDPGWIRAVARDLAAHRGRGLVVAGSHQPASVHEVVAAINVALGNVGTTVTYHPMRDIEPSDSRTLPGLLGALRDGQVRTLVMLGGNPAYDLPADADFASALERVDTTIRLGPYVDESSALADWHLPQTHFLESWGDARAADGTLSVIQPLIRPLFDGRSAAELLALLAYGEPRSGYDLVRETWRELLDAAGFESRWNRVLHDGVLAGSALPPIKPTIRGEAMPDLAVDARRAVGDEGLELNFRPSYAVHDGRFANYGWLQELPDPATKLTWDNVALLSPATARVLDVRTEDVVRLHYRERQLDIPALVLPGQADHSVSVALGYGRSAAGRIGNGVGVNAYAIRASAPAYVDTGLRIEKTGAQQPLAATQDHWAIDEGGYQERARRVPQLYRQASLADYRQHPEFAKHGEFEHPPLKSLFDDHDYSQGYQWGMSIDLNACIGCNACVVACQSENNIPVVGKDQVSRGREMQWLRIDRYFTGEADDPEQMLFQPVTCMHCENAPCEQVCPVAATVHDGEGLNTMVYNRCIGTRYCSNNCPYKVRRFNFYNFTKDTPELLKIAQNPDVTVRSRGVMEKCTYCVQRLNAAKIDARLAGRTIRDGEVRTACQQACPAGAIQFGNLLDQNSEVVRRKSLNRDYVMLEEMNNRPRTSYLARIRNLNSELSHG